MESQWYFPIHVKFKLNVKLKFLMRYISQMRNKYEKNNYYIFTYKILYHIHIGCYLIINSENNLKSGEDTYLYI